jgi:hypothetical protein
MKRVIVSSDLPLVEQLRKDKSQGEREVGRLQRELELVKGRSEGRIQMLEQNLERANLSADQLAGEVEKLTGERLKSVQELSMLQDSVIDQQSEIATLRRRQALIDSELARKDKDAKQLLAAARRYKTRVDYLKSKLRRNRRASKSDEEDPNGSIMDDSPHNTSMLTSSVVGEAPRRRDSIQFPGYMTAEEEYFRLVVMAAKLNVSGTCTPTTVADEPPESASVILDSTTGLDETEVHDPEVDPKRMFEKAQNEKVPFHKWHEWAQDYVLTHQMPVLVGVNNTFTDKKGRGQGFARRVISGGKNKLRALAKLMMGSKRKSVGIAAGGDGF